jgi:hypothetical protein
MSEPSPAPFDPSRYTAEELEYAREVIHWLCRPQPAPEGPFDPSLYSQQELALAAEVASALRRGPSPAPPAEVALGVRVEFDGRSRARLVQTRTTRLPNGLERRQDVGPLTDWFDCPAQEPRRATRAYEAAGFACYDGDGKLIAHYAPDSGGPPPGLVTFSYDSTGSRIRREDPPGDAGTPGQT